MQGNTWKKALAVLSGVAMIGTVGAVVAPANAAENTTCQVSDTSSWLAPDNSYENFTKCLELYRGATSGTYTIQLLNNVTANDNYPSSDSNFKSTEINNANVPLTIEGNGDVRDLQYFHFAVTGGASLTLSNVKVNDALALLSNYSSEIPVFVGSSDASKPSTFTLTNGASLLSDNGQSRAYGIVAGSNSVVNLNSAPAAVRGSRTAAVRGSSAAVITSKNSNPVIKENIPAEAVTNATINITAGDIVNENSQNDGVFAVNVNGADVNLTGTARVQEVYVNNGTFTQTGGRVWPNLDNEYGWFGSDSSVQYPLVLNGTAQAFVSGGDLTGNYKDDQTGNYKDDQTGKGRAVLLRSADAKFNVRADAEVKLGGYDESSKNLGAAPRVLGTVVNKDAGFAAPTQNGAVFSANYTSTDLSKTINGSKLRAFPAQEGEGKTTTFDLKSEAARGTAQNAALLTNSNVVDEKQVKADYSPLHGAQFVYAVGALQDEDSKIVTSIDPSIAHQVYVYGQPTYVGSYNYYDGTKGNPATDANFPTANGLFAGWYDSDKLTTPVTTFPSTTKYPFGYFVSNDTQNVFVQRTKSVNGKFTIRILSSTPNAHFNGFDFVDVRLTSATNFAQSKELTIPANKLYRTANVRSLTGKAETPHKYNESGEDAQYWTAAFITNVPDDWAASYISVTPRWTTLDGTQVTRGAQGNTNTKLPSADQINAPAVKLQPADQQ